MLCGMVPYALKRCTSCYVRGTSSSGAWYVNVLEGGRGRGGIGGTLPRWCTYRGHQLFQWVVPKLWSGSLHGNEWYLHVMGW